MPFTDLSNGMKQLIPEICKNCKYKDKTVVKIGDKTIDAGYSKDFCEKYLGKSKDTYKPHDVFWENKCEFFEEGD